MSSQINNSEVAICKSCGKEYIKRSCIAKGGRKFYN